MLASGVECDEMTTGALFLLFVPRKNKMADVSLVGTAPADWAAFGGLRSCSSHPAEQDPKRRRCSTESISVVFIFRITKMRGVVNSPKKSKKADENRKNLKKSDEIRKKYKIPTKSNQKISNKSNKIKKIQKNLKNPIKPKKKIRSNPKESEKIR